MSEFVEYTEPTWRNLDMRALKVDEAYVVLKNSFNRSLYLYTRSDKCYSCCYSKLTPIPVPADTEEHFSLNVDHAIKFRIFDENLGKYAFDNQTSLCDVYRNDLKEFGVYNFTVNEENNCEFITDKEGVNVNLSLLSAFILVVITLIVLRIGWCAWRSYRYIEGSMQATETATNSENPRHANNRTRLRSIDAIRGMAIVLMIFVNSGGGEYWWMDHAPWNGLHVADVVFPIFLWIMGVCIPISVKVQLVRGAPKLRIASGIIVRSVKLFAIGLCLNSIFGPQLENLRVMGVLQRLAIAYLVCGIVHVVCTRNEHTPSQTPWKQKIHELLILKGEFLVMLVLIVIHLGLLYGLSVPDCPKGYLGPGGRYQNASHPTCIGGAARYIDIQVLGNAHMYQHPTAKHVYDSGAFDPEGVFGCLLSIVHAFLGCLAGVIILVHSDSASRMARWLFWAIGLGLLGGILCLFSIENGYIPINKNMWSLSFVFVTSALGFVILSFCYYIIDEQYWWSGSPFVESGKNSIIMYVGHTVMHKMLPWHWRIGAMNTHFVLIMESIWNTALWMIIALYLDSINFYYSV